MALHGTYGGYREHQRHGENPCAACTAAKAAYDQRWRAAPERTRQNRLYARAQGRALRALARENPGRYRQLYEAALAEVIAEAEQEKGEQG